MTADEFKALLGSRKVRLVVRCGGDNGRCGKVHAAICDDDTIVYNPRHRHEVQLTRKGGLGMRTEIWDALRTMTPAERRSRKPKEIALRPERYIKPRVDREWEAEKNYEMWEASGDRDDESEYDGPPTLDPSNFDDPYD